ncbi:unnamed protein product [Urochloa humidicola]
MAMPLRASLNRVLHGTLLENCRYFALNREVIGPGIEMGDQETSHIMTCSRCLMERWCQFHIGKNTYMIHGYIFL